MPLAAAAAASFPTVHTDPARTIYMVPTFPAMSSQTLPRTAVVQAPPPSPATERAHTDENHNPAPMPSLSGGDMSDMIRSVRLGLHPISPNTMDHRSNKRAKLTVVEFDI